MLCQVAGERSCGACRPPTDGRGEDAPCSGYAEYDYVWSDRWPCRIAAPASAAPSTRPARASLARETGRRCATGQIVRRWAPHPTSAELSTGCTECCGNVDYSTFANCGIFVSRDPCDMSREAIHSSLRRARRGSRTKQHREAVRGGPQGPKRKVSRGCGRNRDRLGEFFWSAACCGARIPARLRSPRCRFHIRLVRRASTRA